MMLYVVYQMNMFVIQLHSLKVAFIEKIMNFCFFFFAFAIEQFQNLDPKKEESFMEFTGLVRF